MALYMYQAAYTAESWAAQLMLFHGLSQLGLPVVCVERAGRLIRR
jgi:hypothetical protein